MKLRHVLTWKFLFYQGLLPCLRRLGPARADAALSAIARASTAAWPPRGRRLADALARARPPGPVAPSALAVGQIRSLARDYLLDGPSDAKSLALFDVEGAGAFRDAIEAGRGVVLVGSHLGGHVAAFHWLYRSGVPTRLMVQRPGHVSSALDALFDRDEADPLPQSAFFLRRGLGKAECVDRLLRARSALRAGKALYLAGDVPWSGPNTRPGRFLGQTRRMLSVWADLSALTGAPAFFTFCNHVGNGRYALAFEPIGVVAPGSEGAAVARYLARLEAVVSARPDDAPAHLLWPCYGPPTSSPVPSPRPSRRVAAAPFGS